MSKELEALEKINHTICLAYNENNNALFNRDKYEHIDCENIEEFITCYNIIEKGLKALDIIKENLNIDEILLAVKGVCKTSDYDLVKEVLL